MNNGDKLQNTDKIFSPFSQEKLNEIFQISPKNPDRILTRESSNLEFKESFGWKSIAKYLKTCASFANAKGGYIVFGIGKQPHNLIGLSGHNLKTFEDMDPELLSGNFNDHFSPEIKWDYHLHELKGKIFGLFYVFECNDKPVVCKKEADVILKEGDIYYRYRGRSERIKYSELHSILDLKREKEQRLWMKHIFQIAKIGVKDIGIFDLKTGHVKGTNGSFIIEESLLSQLSFIKEGEFSERRGNPTLRLIGNVESISGTPIISSLGKKIIRTKGIRICDIVLAFLNQEKLDEPQEYFKQICYETTAFLPVYFFLKQSNIGLSKALEIIEGIISRSQAKTKLIERLKSKDGQYLGELGFETKAAIKKRGFIDLIKSKEISLDIPEDDFHYFFQAILHLSINEIRENTDYICKILKTWFNKNYSIAKSNVVNAFRRAVCWIDEALYKEEIK